MVEQELELRLLSSARDEAGAYEYRGAGTRTRGTAERSASFSTINASLSDVHSYKTTYYHARAAAHRMHVAHALSQPPRACALSQSPHDAS